MRWEILGIFVVVMFSVGSVGIALGQVNTQYEEEIYRLTRQQVRLLYSKGDYAEALRFAEKAVEIAEQYLKDTSPATAEALSYLGTIQRDTGEFAKALPNLKRAERIYTKVHGHEHRDTRVALLNLATLYSYSGDCAGALKNYKKIFKMEQKEEQLGLSVIHTHLGNTYYSMENGQEAEKYLRLALGDTINKWGLSNTHTAGTFLDLGNVYLMTQEYHKALRQYERSRDIFVEVLGLEHQHTGVALGRLADVYFLLKDYEQAQQFYQEALKIAEKTYGINHMFTSELRLNLASLSYTKGAHAKAIEHYKQGLAAQEFFLINTLAVATDAQKMDVKQALGVGYYQALSLLHRHFDTHPEHVRNGLEWVLLRKGIVQDAESRVREIILAHLQGETEVMEAWREWQKLSSELGSLYLAKSTITQREGIEIINKKIKRYIDQINEQQRIITAHGSAFAQQLLQRQQVTVSQLAKRLPRGGALVEFVRIPDWDEKKRQWSADDRYLAFVLTSDNKVGLFNLGQAASIDERISDIKVEIDDQSAKRSFDLAKMRDPSQNVDKNLEVLYTLLFPHSLQKFLGPSTTKLILSPDGELNRLPFAALRTGSGDYLIEKYPISYVTSGRDLWRRPAEVTPTQDLLLVIHPEFTTEKNYEATKELSRLFVSGTESRSILTGHAASEVAVRAVKSPKRLILFTHGFFDDPSPPSNPLTLLRIQYANGEHLRGGISCATSGKTTGLLSAMNLSYLALPVLNKGGTNEEENDGRLTALEVTGMDLHGTDLVMLLACDTGAGATQVGEGVFGLRRAFVLAGAKTLLMSLWKAKATTPVKQMQTFYPAYLGGEHPAEALKKAQVEHIEDLRNLTQQVLGEPLAPVWLWAPFIVQQVGDSWQTEEGLSK